MWPDRGQPRSFRDLNGRECLLTLSGDQQRIGDLFIHPAPIIAAAFSVSF